MDQRAAHTPPRACGGLTAREMVCNVSNIISTFDAPASDNAHSGRCRLGLGVVVIMAATQAIIGAGTLLVKVAGLNTMDILARGFLTGKSGYPLARARS